MLEATNQPKRRRWLPRWSMRSMFVMVTLVSVVFGLVVAPAERQKKAIASLKSNNRFGFDSPFAHFASGKVVWYDYECDSELVQRNVGNRNYIFLRAPAPAAAPPGPTWLHDLIGIDYFANVVRIDFVDTSIIDFRWRIPGEFKEIRSILDDDLRPVRHFAYLEELNLAGSGLTDQGVDHFASLLRLRHLDLSLTWITDDGLAKLLRLTQLQTLNLAGTKISGTGFAHLQNMTEMRRLDLSYTQITDAGLKHLRNMTNLKTLSLARTSVSDEGLRHLAGMDKLTSLDLSVTNITQQGYHTLAAALPGCKIESYPKY